MASSEGGAGTSRRSPRRHRRRSSGSVPIRCWVLQDFQMRQAAFALDLPGGLLRPFGAIARGLYRAFMDYDCSLAEINPLIVNTEGALQAIDAKINLDDNALYRHAELAELRDPQEETAAEREAREHGLSYVQLDGTIGCCVNGAGLAMATMDLVQAAGGQPANFLDIGGGAQSGPRDRGAADHPGRRARAGRAVQHLRRDYALR